MHVWVTGAGGFVGRHLVTHLRDAGCRVSTSDRDVDVTERGAVAEAVTRMAPDAVIHLAAQSSVAASLQDPAGTFRVNYLGTWALLEAVAERAPKARVLVVGSGDQYASAPPGSPP